MSTYGQFVSHPLASGLSMSTYNQFAWLPLAGGLTGLGLVASYFLFRRRGVRAGLRGVAWSLLPLAAYLTGSIKMIWEMASAITGFATSFLFSPEKWAGVAVAGLAFVLFVVTGPLRQGRPPQQAGQPSTATTPIQGSRPRRQQESHRSPPAQAASPPR